MDLQSRKITFIQEFLRLQNEEIVSGLEDLLRRKQAEQYEKNLTPMSAEQFNREIDQAMTDSEQDRVTSALNLREKARKWL